jgi:hypothetical protein
MEKTGQMTVEINSHVFRLRPLAHSRTAIEGYTFKISQSFYKLTRSFLEIIKYRIVFFPDKIKDSGSGSHCKTASD